MTVAYRTGTVAVTNGNAAVTGTGTGWASQVKPGDLFTLDGTRVAEVLSVASNTALTLATNWGGSTASGQAYAISRVSPQWSDVSAASIKLSAFLDALVQFPTPAIGDALKLLRANSAGSGYEFTPGWVIPRETLTAGRTYWVRADGNDANDGLSNTSAGAFRQIQRAVDVVAGLDIGIFTPQINIGAGSYAPVILRPLSGAGGCAIVGDVATPANVVIAGGAANAIVASGVRGYDITGIKLTSTSAGGLVLMGSQIITRVMEYGAVASGFPHIQVANNSVLTEADAIRVTAGAQARIYAGDGGVVIGSSIAVTLVGTPAWSLAGIYAARGGNVFVPFYTYSGTATGPRFIATMNGTIETFSGGAASTLPGSTAGATSLGGQYN